MNNNNNNEYQDQAAWFELWGYDGFRWEFIADFDTRVSAESYDRMYDGNHEETRIKRVSGTL